MLRLMRQREVEPGDGTAGPREGRHSPAAEPVESDKHRHRLRTRPTTSSPAISRPGIFKPAFSRPAGVLARRKPVAGPAAEPITAASVLAAAGGPLSPAEVLEVVSWGVDQLSHTRSALAFDPALLDREGEGPLRFLYSLVCRVAKERKRRYEPRTTYNYIRGFLTDDLKEYRPQYQDIPGWEHAEDLVGDPEETGLL